MLLVGTEVTTVYRSNDGGKSFAELKVPAPGGVVKMNFPTRVLRIAVAPQNPDESTWRSRSAALRSLDGGKAGRLQPDLAFTEQPNTAARSAATPKPRA